MNVKRKPSSKSNESLRPLSVDEVCAMENCSPPLLSIGNRIVWLSDNGPEFGYIKWLGKLPDVGSDWMAGVHFDNPVGSGTGIYNDNQLFEAPVYHASLVPVIGLLRAEDFLGTSNDLSVTTPLSPSSGQTGLEIPQKPKRNKRKPDQLGGDDKLIEYSQPYDYANGEDRIDSSFKNSKSTSRSADLQIHPQDKLSSLPLSRQMATSTSSSSPSSRINSTHISHNNHHNSVNISDSKLAEHDLNSRLVHNGSSNYDELDIGSLVEVTINDIPRYGVIKWIGHMPGQSEDNQLIVGIELEDEYSCGTDGTWNGKRYFDCAPKRGYFVHLANCRKDSRFSSLTERKRSLISSNLANSDSSRITCDIPPLSTLDDLKYLCGKARGIQGHHNSCYLDATLFAMFSCTTIFESLLHRPQSSTDIAEYSEVQRVLKEEIVNPLRANLYVSADRVMHLRTLLEKLTSVRGLTSEEKDPEEFLNLLLNQILKAEPYLKLSSGLESYFYQLFVEKDEKLVLPTVQQLFDQSFLASDFKLREIPPCLLIQMPRFGRQFKMYSRIIPSPYLDITDVLDNSPRQCSICGQLAEYECKECFGQFGEGLDSTAFCPRCLDKSHAHKKRAKHKATKLTIPAEFTMLKDHTQVQRIYMELFAVLCIETSHYVAFVKCGSGPDAPWCFFDSMADRNGEQDGYNIPEVISFPNLRWWLSEEGTALLLTTKDDKLLPEMARRLLCDAYMCMYQSQDLMMYR